MTNRLFFSGLLFIGVLGNPGPHGTLAYLASSVQSTANQFSAGTVHIANSLAMGATLTAGLSGAGQTAAAAGFSLQQVSGPGAPCYVYSGSGQVPLCAQHGGTWTNPYANGSLLTLSNPLLVDTTYTAVESANDASNLVVSSSATWTTAAS